MSRCIQRRNNRITRELNHERWLDDVAAHRRAEAERARLATRLREVSARVRLGGRAEDVAELDGLWRAIASMGAP